MYRFFQRSTEYISELSLVKWIYQKNPEIRTGSHIVSGISRVLGWPVHGATDPVALLMTYLFSAQGKNIDFEVLDHDYAASHGDHILAKIKNRLLYSRWRETSSSNYTLY